MAILETAAMMAAQGAGNAAAKEWDRMNNATQQFSDSMQVVGAAGLVAAGGATAYGVYDTIQEERLKEYYRPGGEYDRNSEREHVKFLQHVDDFERSMAQADHNTNFGAAQTHLPNKQGCVFCSPSRS